jgi:hypothetical protein
VEALATAGDVGRRRSIGDRLVGIAALPHPHELDLRVAGTTSTVVGRYCSSLVSHGGCSCARSIVIGA